MPKLIVRHPEKGEMTFPLTGDRVTVGRRGDNAIQINHGTISGHHAEFVAVNGHYVLKDLDSTNHCFVDGFQVSEADLSERCKLMIGTIECEFIPDDASAPGEVENLRKTIGLLRAQNEELVAKMNEQQKQIDILGSARLFTPATGADMNSLREQVKSLTKENQTLKAEVERLRTIAARNAEAATLKATVPINPDAAVAVGPAGETVQAPPIAKVVSADPIPEAASKLADVLGKARTVVAKLAKKPADAEARKELASTAERLAEAAKPLGQHPVARLVDGVEALIRDVSGRKGAVEASVIGSLEDSVETLGKLLAPEMLKRAGALPTPSILAVDADNDILPAMVAALEFGRFQTTGVSDAEKALTQLKDGAFDLILLGVPLPGATPQDASAPLRDIPNCKGVPVISLTSGGAPPPEGISDWLAKPLNMFELTLKAQTWVLKRQLGVA